MKIVILILLLFTAIEIKAGADLQIEVVNVSYAPFDYPKTKLRVTNVGTETADNVVQIISLPIECFLINSDANCVQSLTENTYPVDITCGLDSVATNQSKEIELSIFKPTQLSITFFLLVQTTSPETEIKNNSMAGVLK